jgi:hypothetical protein
MAEALDALCRLLARRVITVHYPRNRALTSELDLIVRCLRELVVTIQKGGSIDYFVAHLLSLTVRHTMNLRGTQVGGAVKLELNIDALIVKGALETTAELAEYREQVQNALDTYNSLVLA